MGHLLSDVWTIGNIPFHIGVRGAPTNGYFPDVRPFTLGVDQSLVALRQVPDEELRATLHAVYIEGSQAGTPMAECGMGREAAIDFLSYIESSVLDSSLQVIKDASVLEVGCGTAYLLRLLRERQANVLGVEPGLESADEAERAGIRVIHDEFERCKFEEQFDAIIHYAVLEHSPDPIKFLARQIELLRERGLLIFAVPDCTEPIAHGDLSMFIHQHWNYFSTDSIRKLASAVGARLLSCRRSGIGGLLYCTFARGQGPDGSIAAQAAEHLASFRVRAERGMERLDDLGQSLKSHGSSFGVFCPGRFINYHQLIRSWPTGARYFDDDPLIHAKYYPPLDIQVESRASLLAEPVETLLIMSRTFGRQLSEQLRTHPELSRCEILTVADIF